MTLLATGETIVIVVAIVMVVFVAFAFLIADMRLVGISDARFNPAQIAPYVGVRSFPATCPLSIACLRYSAMHSCSTSITSTNSFPKMT